MKRSPGVEIRGDSIRISFRYRGQRCRETLKLSPTPKHVRYAERLRAAILHEIELGTFNYAKRFPGSKRIKRLHGSALTVARALEEWLAGVRRELQPSTVTFYQDRIEADIIPVLGHETLSPVMTLTTAMIRSWRDGLKVSNRSVNAYITPLKAMLGQLYADGVIQEDPSARIRPLPIHRAEPDPFSADEMARLLAAMKPDIRALYEFAFWTGLRPSELIALRWEDVDLVRGTVYVCRSRVRGVTREHTKTQAGKRTVRLLTPAREALLAQKPRTFMMAGEVFHKPQGGAWDAVDQLHQRAWEPAIRRAGVRYRSQYQTRHTYASMVLSAGEDVAWLAQQLGHTSPAITLKTYARYLPDMRPDAGSRVEAMIGGQAEKMRGER